MTTFSGSERPFMRSEEGTKSEYAWNEHGPAGGHARSRAAQRRYCKCSGSTALDLALTRRRVPPKLKLTLSQLRRAAMYRKSILLLAALALVVLGVGFMTAQDKTAKGPDREADKQAIDKLDQGEHPGVQQPRRGRDRRELDRRGRVHSQRRRADPRAGRDPEGVRGVLQDAEGQAEAGGPDGRPSLHVGGHGRFGSHPAAEKRTRRIDRRRAGATPCWSGKAASGRWPSSRNGIATMAWT